MPADETDRRLHEGLLAGDDDALAEVYDRWSALVYSLALRITEESAAAEDVTQDVFLGLWQAPERYDPRRGALRTWLCLWARGRALDWVRRRRVRWRRDAVFAAVAAAGGGSDLDAGVMWETEAKVVREAVHCLPPPQRTVVLLTYYHGRTYREAAAELGIPEGTAKSRLRAALAALASRLETEGILER